MSMKRHWVELFPNDERYQIKHTVVFFQKLIKVINNIAPLRTARIKNPNEPFDWEIPESLRVRHGIFNKFKSNQLKIDLDIYKEARNQVQRLIKNKKKIF